MYPDGQVVSVAFMRDSAQLTDAIDRPELAHELPFSGPTLGARESCSERAATPAASSQLFQIEPPDQLTAEDFA